MDMFWHPRFMVGIHIDLVSFVMPFLPTLRELVERLGNKAGTSMRAVVKALEFLTVVAIQDGLELCGAYPSHPVHVWLLSNPSFRYVKISYQNFTEHVHCATDFASCF